MSDIVERCRKNQCAENTGCHTNPFCSCSDLEDAADRILELESKLASAEDDAERYRWLKSGSRVEQRSGGYEGVYCIPPIQAWSETPYVQKRNQAFRHHSLDEAIDSARSAK